MSENERREVLERLAQRMRLERIPDGVAENLHDGDVRAVYLQDDEESWSELANETERLLRVYRSAPQTAAPPGRSNEREAADEIEVQLSDYTRRRGEVFAELIGIHPDVIRLRSGVTGYPLSRQDADALSDVDADDFYKVVGTNRHKVDGIAERLARRYGWRKPQARRFLLTGVAPLPIRVAVFSGKSSQKNVPTAFRIIVTADVWVNAVEVSAAFRAAQTQVLGHENRRVSNKTMEVASFVAKNIRERGKRPAWSKLLEAWNEEHPTYRYSDFRALRLAFLRFLHPEHKRPVWKRRDPD